MVINSGLALLPHSKKFLGLIPGSFLCGVYMFACMGFLRARRFSPTAQRHGD